MSSQGVVAEQRMRERHCVHRSQGAPGEFYRGEQYVAALQRLRSAAAMRVTGKVEAFFWADAPRVKVWLCHDCATEIGL